MNVVLLSASKHRVEAFRAASKRRGFALTVTSDEHAAAQALNALADPLLILDVEASAHPNNLLAQRSPSFSILVVAPRFDAKAWIEMFKSGATEVITDPLTADKLEAALDALEHRPDAVQGSAKGWRAVVGRLRFRFGI